MPPPPWKLPKTVPLGPRVAGFLAGWVLKKIKHVGTVSNLSSFEVFKTERGGGRGRVPALVQLFCGGVPT